MKFTRGAHVFRGQLDAAPFAGVFFLLMIFLAFQTSLVFVPGVPVRLASPGQTNTLVLEIDRAGQLRLQGENCTETELTAQLRREGARAAQAAYLIVRTDPGLTNPAVARVVELARQAHVPVSLTGARLDLPEAAGLAGLARPMLVVAVDLNGQYYFENQALSETELPGRLAAARHRMGDNPVLVLLADRSVPYDIIIHLGEMARIAGLNEILMAARPAANSAP